jgi:hypothetical protein
MSDVSQGPGWWRASDGRWYPPEQHPDYVPPPPAPPPAVPEVPPAVTPPLPPVPPTPLGPPLSGPFGTPPLQSPYGVPPGQSPYGVPPGQSPYGFMPWAVPQTPPVTNSLAIAALVLAILWIGGLGSTLAVIFGLVALSQIRSSSGRKQGKGLATAGLVIGAVGLVGAVLLFSLGSGVSNQSPHSSKDPPPAGSLAPRTNPASATVMRELTNVPARVVASVGVPSQSIVVPPTIKVDQPKLVVDGKPGAVFIGGVFCPYCAAERWAIIMAFSRFGTFAHVQETTSSPWDVYPRTATFSFHRATYSSRYLALAISEHSGNDVDGPGTDPVLDPLTNQEARLWQTYDDSFGYPFLDIGNKSFVLSPSFTPALLSGLDQADIASKLSDPNAPSTQAIVGTANYLTAAICAMTGQSPASVCTSPVVRKASQAMNLQAGERLASHIGVARQ